MSRKWTGSGVGHSPVKPPSPALVTQRAARRLPRLGLWLLAAVYLLPGLVGRDPWRNADATAFGLMVAMAEGRTDWLAPTLGGLALDVALLPHWLGAVAIALSREWLSPEVAARLPFTVLLAATLGLVWRSGYELARTEAAQPVAFAFGGEAHPVDYARAVADGALLALMATLGLLQLGHETTPELAQLASISLVLYALAAAPRWHWQPRLALLLALPGLAACGAPAVATAVGAGAALVCGRSRLPPARALLPWIVAATLLAVVATALLKQEPIWQMQLRGSDWPGIARQWLWFLWPAWLLAVWTLWRWRRHWSHRHLSVPLVVVLVPVVASVMQGGSDRLLLLSLPGLAVLAAFALPTLRRSTAAAVDWFSVFFFSLGAFAIWVVYLSLHTGFPAKPAANVFKLAPGFEPQFSLPAVTLALLGSVAWLALVRWRTGRHQEALWKSLVLPAGGVALSWLLLMTLWLPLLDFARSPRPLVQRLAPHLPPAACVLAVGQAPSMLAAMEHYGRWRVVALADPSAVHPPTPATAGCDHLLLRTPAADPPPAVPGWVFVAQARRPTDREELARLYRQIPPQSEPTPAGNSAEPAASIKP